MKRVLSLRRVAEWIGSLMGAITKGGRAILRAISELVDGATGQSHARYPITLERIGNRAGYTRRSVTTWIGMLERMGWLEVVRHSPTWSREKGFYQQPNVYRVLLPKECWVEVHHPDETAVSLSHNGPREKFVSPASLTMSVRGRLSTAVTDERLVRSPQKEELDGRLTTYDFTTPEELAPVLGREAAIAAASTCEARRFVAVVGIQRLIERVAEVANEMARRELTVRQAKLCVVQWVKRTLANEEQYVQSADHAVNILLSFVKQKGRLVGDDRERRASSLLDQNAMSSSGYPKPSGGPGSAGGASRPRDWLREGLPPWLGGPLPE